MKSEKEKIGVRIKELRKSRGLSQEQLAEIIGIEQKHVSRLEVGKSYPTIDRLEKIAIALDVPMGSFFDDIGGRVIYAEKAEKLTRMIRELDENYQGIVFKLSQIMKELNEITD